MASLILGIGSVSSQFTVKLVRELARGPREHGLVAVGIFDNGKDGQKVRNDIRWAARRLSVTDISVTSLRGATPAFELLNELKRRAWKKAMQQNVQEILLIIDARFVTPSVIIFRDLRKNLPNTRMTAICFTDESAEDVAAYEQIENLTNPGANHDNLCILEAAFMVSTRSPLATAVGGQNVQSDLVAKSLAGIWTAPLFRNYNPTFENQVRGIRDPNNQKTFIGMALGVQGLTMRRTGFLRTLLYPIARFTTWFITVDEATTCVVDATRSALELLPVPTTTVRPFEKGEIHQTPISVNIIIPFRLKSKKFNPTADAVLTKLGNTEYVKSDDPNKPSIKLEAYTIEAYSAVKGRGVNLATNSTLGKETAAATAAATAATAAAGSAGSAGSAVTVPQTVRGVVKGRFYCQVCVLYAIGQDEIVKKAIDADKEQGAPDDTDAQVPATNV